MLLAIDIGNTNIVIGVLEGEKIYFTERFSTDHSKMPLEYTLLFRSIFDMYDVDPEQIEVIMERNLKIKKLRIT